jgi:hypothetical protein
VGSKIFVTFKKCHRSLGGLDVDRGMKLLRVEVGSDSQVMREKGGEGEERG